MNKKSKYLQVFEMRQQGFSCQEVAEILGIKLRRVYEYYSQARHKEKYLKKQQLANRRYYERHKEEISKRKKIYNKTHSLQRLHTVLGTRINGKSVTIRNIKKRPIPNLCELCQKRKPKAYHHWDDNNPDIGMWLCNGCHFKVEWFEKGGAVAYHHLKKQIELDANCKLPEPTLALTEQLITELGKFTAVRIKKLRKAWYE